MFAATAASIGAATFAEALATGTECYHALKAVLKKEGLSTGLGDEGGFAPDLGSNREALDLIVAAIETTGLQPGADIAPYHSRQVVLLSPDDCFGWLDPARAAALFRRSCDAKVGLGCLGLARRAVFLVPDSVSYRDTLAEPRRAQLLALADARLAGVTV